MESRKPMFGGERNLTEYRLMKNKLKPVNGICYKLCLVHTELEPADSYTQHYHLNFRTSHCLDCESKFCSLCSFLLEEKLEAKEGRWNHL